MCRLHLGDALGLEKFKDFAEEWVVLDELDEWQYSHGVEDIFHPRRVFRALEEPQGLAKGEVTHYVESGKVHHLAERHFLTGGLSQFRNEQVDVLVEQGLLLSETAFREGWGEDASHSPVVISLCREKRRYSCSSVESTCEGTAVEMHKLTIQRRHTASLWLATNRFIQASGNPQRRRKTSFCLLARGESMACTRVSELTEPLGPCNSQSCQDNARLHLSKLPG